MFMFFNYYWFLSIKKTSQFFIFLNHSLSFCLLLFVLFCLTEKISPSHVFFCLRAATMLAATMKRFFVTTILTVVIGGVLAHFMPRDFTHYLNKFDACATVTIYCRQTNLEGVDMGGGFKVECDAENFSKSAAQCQGIDGVSVSFEGSYDDVEELCKFFRLRVSQMFEQDGLYVTCGKSSKIRGGVLDGDEVVNLQIAYKDGVIHVGSPLILGDY